MEAKTASSAKDPEPVTGRTASAREAELDLRSVGTRFGTLAVLEGIDLQLRPGEIVALVGPSGCGKSTLLELVAGLAEPLSGTIAVDGCIDAAERLERCAYMPQRDMLLPWLRAIDNAALGLRLQGSSRQRAREQARPLLAAPRPGRLRRGAARRALGRNAPARGLRPHAALRQAAAAARRAARRTRRDQPRRPAGVAARRPGAGVATVLLVTHDVEEALFVADRIVVLRAGPGAPSSRSGRRRGASSGPRGDRHRSRLRRPSRAGAAGARRGRPMRAAAGRMLPPAILFVALLAAWQLAASEGVLADLFGIEPFLVPRRRRSPSRSGRTARCLPTTRWSPCARSGSASPLAVVHRRRSSPRSSTSRRCCAVPSIR